MATIVRSARGEMVDLDLLQIKQQVADAAATAVVVQSTTQFINHRPPEGDLLPPDVEAQLMASQAASFDDDPNADEDLPAMIEDTPAKSKK